jgi:cytochrome b561
MSSVPLPRTPGLRLSHAVVGLAAIHQLINSEFMEPPWEFDEASALQKLMFEFHEWVGLVAAAALLLMLFCLWRRYGGALRARFLPWLDGEQRATMLEQARAAFSGMLRLDPPAAPNVALLASAWEGLGLLTLAFMALTGTAMALLEGSPGLMHDLGEIHELGALPLKLYIGGHVGMALLHELRGEGLIRRMWGGRQT